MIARFQGVIIISKNFTCRKETIEKVFGNTSGLSASELQSLSKLYRRRVPRDHVATPELTRTLSSLSHELKKTISLIIDRKGKVHAVFLGEAYEVPFDSIIERSREAKHRLRGYRLLYARLGNHALTHSDLVTMTNERLDLICSIEVRDNGIPGKLQIAHILPPNPKGDIWKIYDFSDVGRLNLNFEELVGDIENEILRSRRNYVGTEEKEGVFLIGFTTGSKHEAEESLKELHELAISANKVVLERVVQVKKHPDPRYLIGKGKLEEVILRAKQVGADTLIFNVELTPAQVKAISDQTNLGVMDRTQLILEIFAKRAKTSEGKIQVRLAQLKYMLPRLTGKGTEFSQLGGGIGTRGPGEKKLEEQRRMLRKQIERLEEQIEKIAERRERGRKYRKETGIPTVTIIGYTSAGKSTLFNTITKSDVETDERLFSTLMPTTRKILLPSGREILVTDTVGFIRDLPNELVKAFRATLEELGESTLLLHLADASDPSMDSTIDSVEKILESSGYGDIPRMLVLNKADKLSPSDAYKIKRIYNAPLISAFDRSTFDELLETLDIALSNMDQPHKETPLKEETARPDLRA